MVLKASPGYPTTRAAYVRLGVSPTCPLPNFTYPPEHDSARLLDSTTFHACKGLRNGLRDGLGNGRGCAGIQIHSHRRPTMPADRSLSRPCCNNPSAKQSSCVVGPIRKISAVQPKSPKIRDQVARKRRRCEGVGRLVGFE